MTQEPCQHTLAGLRPNFDMMIEQGQGSKSPCTHQFQDKLAFVFSNMKSTSVPASCMPSPTGLNV